MKKLRILALMHDYLVPPTDTSGFDLATVEWKTEFDVMSTLIDMGHDVYQLGINDELGKIQEAINKQRPHIAFNLLEAFNETSSFDQNLVAYLELLRVPYTGCNPRGLLLSRDKALSKKLLAYHKIPIPDFTVYRIGQSVRRPINIQFPLIVKSLTQDASIGISQASVVHDHDKLRERVKFIHNHIGTDAIIERYIEGRELYVGILGNERLTTFPIWELKLSKMPNSVHRIATDRVKWNSKYQRKHGIDAGAANNISPALTTTIQQVCRQVYRTLDLSGYARIDLRLDNENRFYVLEANPNPQISWGEDFAESAEFDGLPYEALLQRILNNGLTWKPDHRG